MTARVRPDFVAETSSQRVVAVPTLFSVAVVKSAQTGALRPRHNYSMSIIDFSKASRMRAARDKIAACRKSARERTTLADHDPQNRTRHLNAANAWLLLAARVVQTELRSHLNEPAATDRIPTLQAVPSPIKE
jgi:hypothetical protein